MNLVDIVALSLIALGSLHGFIRGLSGELSHLISLIASFIFGIWFYEPFGMWLSANTRLTAQPAHALAFIATILVALIILLCLRYFLRTIMKVVIEEKFDRIGGLVAGLLRSTIIVVIIFVFMNLIPHEYLNQEFGDDSIIGSFIKPHISYITEKAEAIHEKNKRLE